MNRLFHFNLLLITIGFLLFGLSRPAAGQKRGQTTKVDDVVDNGMGDQEHLQNLDLSEIVQAATKRVTTVSESPLIVHIITSDEIKKQGYIQLNEALGRLPGYLPNGHTYSLGPSVITHGITSGAVLLFNGVSLNDLTGGYQVYNRSMPMEMIRRIETTTGPGGVLWGSGSFVGVIAVTSKTADDLEGVEAAIGIGAGPGLPDTYRMYVMGGQKFFDGKIKGLLHISAETFRTARRDQRQNFMASIPPLSRGPHLFGPVVPTVPKRSWIVSLDGNVQAGDFTIGWHVPFENVHYGASFNGTVISEPLGEWDLDKCTTPGPTCVDPDNLADINLDIHDRFTYLGYSTRLWKNRIDLNAKVSYYFAARRMLRYSAIVGSSLLPGGMTYSQALTGHQAAGTLDVGIRIAHNHRLLTGAEVSYATRPEDHAVFLTYPSSIPLLPIDCPPTTADGEMCKILHSYASNRLMGAAFIDDQISFGDLTLEAGIRLEAAGGKRGYAPELLLSGAAVYRLFGETFAKVNYAEGFRPPQFSKTDQSGIAVEWISNPDLENERSRSILGQISTTLLRDVGRISKLGIQTNYSYTWVSNYINAVAGLFTNSEDIGVHAVEFGAQMNLRGGHSLSIGYTFQNIADARRGNFRGLPAQWFSSVLYLQLIGDYLGVNSNLLIIGSAIDTNKWAQFKVSPTYLGRTAIENGVLVPVADETYLARGSDVVWDKVHPAAVWNLGVQSLLLHKTLRLRVDVYNLLNANYYYPDPYFDVAALLEATPNAGIPIGVYCSATYQY